MSREIKFRFWDKKNLRFVDFLETDDCIQNALHGAFKFHGGLPTKVISISNPDLVAQQWTGACDKHGAEIWEGDIVKFGQADDLIDQEIKYYFAIIGYQSEYECFVAWLPKGMTRGHEGTLPIHRLSDIEVVGNIFENEELLKGSHDF